MVWKLILDISKFISIFNLIIFYFYNNSLVANKDYQALPRYFAPEKGRMQFLSMKNTQQVSNNTASHTKYHLYHCNECNLNLNIFSGPPASQLGMAGITVEFVKLFVFPLLLISWKVFLPKRTWSQCTLSLFPLPCPRENELAEMWAE